MKRVLKEHWLILTILVVMICLIGYNCFHFLENQRRIENSDLQLVNYCESGQIKETDVDFCNVFLQSFYEEKNIKVDFYTMMTDVLVFNMQYLNAVAFLLVVVPTLVSICKILKNKYIINYSTRHSYKSFLKEYFHYAYRYIWLLPVIASVLIMICMSNTTFNPEYALRFGSSIWKSNIIYSPIVFILLYLLNILLYSFTFINISLIVVRKQHNYIKAVILSFVTYIGLEIFLEIVLNVLICQNIFKTDIGHLFNIINIFTFSDVFGTLQLMIFTVVMFILSFVGVYLVYRNKENFIIDCEKNN